MNVKNRLIKDNKYSLLSLALLFCLSITLIAFLNKGDMVLFFDKNRSDSLNYFFLIATKLAEPIVCVTFCLLLLFLSWKKGLFLSLCLIFNTAVVQFLKRIVFSDFQRPMSHYRDELELIEGMRANIDFSFPSGHTMAGATLFFVLSLFVKGKLSKLAVVAIIPVVAISRVYLSQHYFMDVVAGGTLGVLLCCWYYYLFQKSKFAFE